jgi:hypothetical protein
MTISHFKVGDRVRLRATRHMVQVGALGTVQEVLEVVNAYIIVFDGLIGPRLVWGNILEQADEATLAPSVGATW